MKQMLFAIFALVIATQASAGTALVLKSTSSSLHLIYSAADSADDTEGPDFEVGVCDDEFNNCIKFDGQIAKDTYQQGACVITITKTEQNETVKILKGAEGCKVLNGKNLESINGTYNYNF